MAEPQIVAVGGLGEDDDAARLIDDFVLGLTGKDRPHVCLVPTASAEAADLLLELGIIKSKPDVATLVDTQFIK